MDVNQPCRQTKFFFPVANGSLALALSKFSRKSFSVIVEFITGHNFLNRQNAIVDGIEEDHSEWEVAMCSYCDSEGEESTYHILTECEFYRTKREEVFGERYLEHPFKIKARKMLEFIQLDDIETFADQM